MTNPSEQATELEFDIVANSSPGRLNAAVPKSPTRSEGSRRGWEKRKAGKAEAETPGALTKEQAAKIIVLSEEIEHRRAAMMSAAADLQSAIAARQTYLDSLTKGS